MKFYRCDDSPQCRKQPLVNRFSTCALARYLSRAIVSPDRVLNGRCQQANAYTIVIHVGIGERLNDRFQRKFTLL